MPTVHIYFILQHHAISKGTVSYLDKATANTQRQTSAFQVILCLFCLAQVNADAGIADLQPPQCRAQRLGSVRPLHAQQVRVAHA